MAGTIDTRASPPPVSRFRTGFLAAPLSKFKAPCFQGCIRTFFRPPRIWRRMLPSAYWKPVIKNPLARAG